MGALQGCRSGKFDSFLTCGYPLTRTCKHSAVCRFEHEKKMIIIYRLFFMFKSKEK